jgi:hypothetical protein
MMRAVAALAVLAAVAVARTDAFEILIPPGKEKCLTESFDPDTIAHVKAHVSAGQLNRPGTNMDFQARMNALNANQQAGGAATISMTVNMGCLLRSCVGVGVFFLGAAALCSRGWGGGFASVSGA